MRVTLEYLQSLKRENKKITMLTCYDYSFALLLDKTGIDIVLVGDSLGTVIKGEGTTVHVTLDETIYHTKAVRRGIQRAFLVADMPFGTFQGAKEQAIENVMRVVRESNADAVKMEGSGPLCSTIQAIVRSGVPVMGHVGLTPQTASSMGGFRVQGKDRASAQRIREDALSLQDAGVFSIVLECVTAEVAEYVSKKLSVPTIGIGSGSGCNGQVLVLYDMLGLFGEMNLKFVRRYADLSQEVVKAVGQFTREVQGSLFPSGKESFSIPSPDFLKDMDQT